MPTSTRTHPPPAAKQVRARLHNGDEDRSQACEQPVEHLDLQGVSVRAFDSERFGRYVWVDLELGDGEPVRALGEIADRGHPASVALEIRFKHLFPDYRRRLEEALRAKIGQS
ncbi:MAG: hypothetical protein EXR77_06890 [Myxococcales bacterium]|nr:hypothetical protein [Myxococcales bacterium]